MKVLKLILFILVAIDATCAVKAQDEVYQLELGGGVGGSFYLGDANSKPFAHMGASAMAVARYIINPRMALKANLGVAHISGNNGNTFIPVDAASETQQGGTPARVAFSRNVFDLGAQFELNFWGYGIGRGYEGYSRITPYLVAGVGLSLAPKPYETNVGFNVPLGVGLKYKLRKRLNIGLEWTMRFTTSDGLDASSAESAVLFDPYNMQSKGFKNKDCYSLTMLTITYDLLPKCVNCNNIKYVF